MNFISTEEMMGRFIENYSLKQGGYNDLLIPWVFYGLRQMKFRVFLQDTFEKKEVCDGIAMLPYGLDKIDAVIYNGRRLRKLPEHVNISFVSTYNDSKTSINSLDEIFQTDITDANKINKIKSLEQSNEYYKIQLGAIQTSFEEGIVYILYKKRPTASNGYPLIPDNENVQQALEWWLYAQLIKAGFDPKQTNLFRVSYDDAISKFERYGRRGINEINIPTDIDTIISTIELEQSDFRSPIFQIDIPYANN